MKLILGSTVGFLVGISLAFVGIVHADWQRLVPASDDLRVGGWNMGVIYDKQGHVDCYALTNTLLSSAAISCVQK